MSKKEQFIQFINDLLQNSSVEMLPDVEMYWNTFQMDKNAEKPQFTENGKLIIDFLQKSTVEPRRSRDIADELFISSRSVSGSMRKLVSDGFVEKIGQDPVMYVITEKGKKVKI